MLKDIEATLPIGTVIAVPVGVKRWKLYRMQGESLSGARLWAEACDETFPSAEQARVAYFDWIAKPPEAVVIWQPEEG